MNISERAIQKGLIEKGYKYVGWKIKPKMTCMTKRSDLIGVIII